MKKPQPIKTLNKLHTKAIKHSMFINKIRSILPVIGIVIIFIIILWAYIIDFFEEEIKINFKNPVNANIQNEAINVRLFAKNNNYPYKIIAEKFIKIGNNKAVFINPEGFVSKKNGKEIKIIAKEGHMDIKTNKIFYPGQMEYTDSEENHLISTDVWLDLGAKTLQSKNKTVTNFKNSEIISDQGFFINKDKQIINFYGKSKITIFVPK